MKLLSAHCYFDEQPAVRWEVQMRIEGGEKPPTTAQIRKLLYEHLGLEVVALGDTDSFKSKDVNGGQRQQDVTWMRKTLLFPKKGE